MNGVVSLLRSTKRFDIVFESLLEFRMTDDLPQAEPTEQNLDISVLVSIPFSSFEHAQGCAPLAQSIFPSIIIWLQGRPWKD